MPARSKGPFVSALSYTPKLGSKWLELRCCLRIVIHVKEGWKVSSTNIASGEVYVALRRSTRKSVDPRCMSSSRMNVNAVSMAWKPFCNSGSCPSYFGVYKRLRCQSCQSFYLMTTVELWPGQVWTLLVGSGPAGAVPCVNRHGFFTNVVPAGIPQRRDWQRYFVYVRRFTNMESFLSNR